MLVARARRSEDWRRPKATELSPAGAALSRGTKAEVAPLAEAFWWSGARLANVFLALFGDEPHAPRRIHSMVRRECLRRGTTRPRGNAGAGIPPTGYTRGRAQVCAAGCRCSGRCNHPAARAAVPHAGRHDLGRLI